MLDLNSVQSENAGLCSLQVNSHYGSIIHYAHPVVVNPPNVALGFYPRQKRLANSARCGDCASIADRTILVIRTGPLRAAPPSGAKLFSKASPRHSRLPG